MELFNQLESWQWWIAAALVLMILEVATPGFLLACFSMAALLSALAAWMGWSLSVQMLFFALGGIVAMMTVRPVMVKLLTRPERPGHAESLVGRRCQVMRITDGAAYVDIDGQFWLARSEDETPLTLHQAVEVIAVGGASVTVRPVNSQD